MLKIFCSLICLMFLVACGGQDPAGSSVIGSWGSSSAIVVVDSSGATLDFHCAHGKISTAIVLDAAGKFSLPGDYIAEHGGGSTGRDEVKKAATFTGTIVDDTFTLSITVLASAESIGPFVLQRNSKQPIIKCP